MKDEVANGKTLNTLLHITERIGLPCAMLLVLGYLTLAGFDNLNACIANQTIVLERITMSLNSFTGQVTKEHEKMSNELRDIERSIGNKPVSSGGMY